ncbi:hypothetical protein SAMN02927924_03542 [Sphingobium faniae]|nr:hypothetical protein SAMN02927924_03542 [Sphingobium faniae]
MREISKHQTIISSRLLAQRQARSGMGGCLARTCQSSNGRAENMFAKGLLEDLAETMREGSLGEISRWKGGDEHRWTGPTSFPQMAEHLDPIGFLQPVVRDKAAGVAGGRIGKQRGPGCVGPNIETPGTKQKL